MARGENRLGVDFGRVINDASGSPSGEDTAFLDGTEAEMLATPAMKGAFASLERLCRVFEGQVWIVSKCGPAVQGRTERWLAHHRFFESTGIAPDHLRFCRRREDKAVHCKELGITHFVDDRYDVLRHLIGLVPHLYLFGPQETPPAQEAQDPHEAREPQEQMRRPAGVVPTANWDEAEQAILATLGR